LIFNENFILGSCHPAVVSFLCKKWETGKKFFFIARAHPGAASKKRIGTYSVRGVKKFFFQTPS
jgi:hypothetical protein